MANMMNEVKLMIQLEIILLQNVSKNFWRQITYCCPNLILLFL